MVVVKKVIYINEGRIVVKKILVIITTGMSPYGGLTTVAMNYYRQLDFSCYEVDFVSSNVLNSDLETELQEHNSHYFQIKNRNSKPLAYFLTLSKLCRGYDVVHVHANSATATIELLAAKNAGVKKRIIHIHNTTCTHKIVHRILKPVFDKCYTDALACSKAAGEWIFPKGKFVVLNNAIDLEMYSYSVQNRHKIREKYCIGDELLIGNVGKLIEQKNHLFALQVFKEVLKSYPTAKFMIVGGGILESSLREKATELGIADRVIFCGMTNSAVPYLSAFDVVLFPSLWEGLPLSLIEAQANGLKCIISDSITSEVDMGGVVSLSLESDLHIWSEALIKSYRKDRETFCSIYHSNMIDKGFDIRENAKKIEEIYRGD